MLDKIIPINHFQVDIDYFCIRILYTGTKLFYLPVKECHDYVVSIIVLYCTR